jgi:hypothetical protein
MMKKLIFLFLVIGWCGTGFSQGLTATADKQAILIGEQFSLKLQGFFQKGQAAPWFGIDTIPHFEILERSKIDTQQNADNILLSQTLTVTSWDSGRWQIPALMAGRSKTNPITITVSFTSPFDPNQPYHDVKDILDVKAPNDSKWYWYLIGIIVLIALFMLFFPPTKKKETTEFVSDEGAYKTAIKKLGKLEERREPEPGIFYTELVHIFREYLHRRKNIQSFSKTTDDLSVQVKQLNLSTGKYTELVQTLRLSDMVKFARFQPSATENEQALQTIKESIIAIEGL